MYFIHDCDSVSDYRISSHLLETLRKYPVAPLLFRECTREYKIPGTDVTLEKGTTIMIPIFSLQRDEKYYANPHQFDPSRFFSENTNGKTIVDMPYLPFGNGPRNCIGMRMGKMFVKVGVAAMLQKYRVELDEQHIDGELLFVKSAPQLQPRDGIHLKFNVRNSSD